MGIFILPFLIIAIVIVLYAVYHSLQLYLQKKIQTKEILFGLLITSFLFILICIAYLVEGKAWGLSPAFRIPTVMIFLPFFVFIATKSSKQPKIKYLSTLLIISIGLTGILGAIFNQVFFELIHILGIEEQY